MTRSSRATGDASPATSLARAFALLDLFSLGQPLLTVDGVMDRLGYTRSTAYRYLRDLTDAGLVTQSSAGAYSLGPRIVELERLMALTDPLYRAGEALLRDAPCGNSALLLHNLYEDRVLCIYKSGPDALEDRGRRIVIRRARGLPFPLFQGAASLALLPYLSPHRIRQTYLRHAGAIAASGLGTQWEEFRRHLGAIRRAGYATSHGTITPSVSGVAVPILAPGGTRVLGSLARAFATAAPPEGGEEACAAELRGMAVKIAQACAQSSRH